MINLMHLWYLVSHTTRLDTQTTGMKHWLVLVATLLEDDMSNVDVQIVDFLNNFSNASCLTQQLDRKILQNASSVSDGLGDLVTLATPQVYGNMQLTIGTDAHGNLNESDVMIFMRNIGGASAR